MPKAGKRSFIADIIWPKHTLHVISGTSGTWKTALLFSLFRDWEQGKPILGQYKSYPEEWAYIAFDRDLGETWDTLDSIKYAPDDRRIHSAYNDPRFPSQPDSIVKAMDILLPKTGGVLILDGMQFLAPFRNDMGQFQTIGTFVRHIRQQAQKRNITCIGVCHNAKAHKGEEYAHPRDRIMGSVAWGASTGTLMALENKNSEDKTLWVCPRTAPEYQLTISRTKDGIIFVRNENEDTDSNLELTSQLAEVPPGTLLKRETVLIWAAEAELSESTAEKWLNKQVKTGALSREGRGTYRVPYQQ